MPPKWLATDSANLLGAPLGLGQAPQPNQQLSPRGKQQSSGQTVLLVNFWGLSSSRTRQKRYLKEKGVKSMFKSSQEVSSIFHYFQRH